MCEDAQQFLEGDLPVNWWDFGWKAGDHRIFADGVAGTGRHGDW